MIAQIEGPVVHADSDEVIIRAGGVGYRIFITPDTREAVAGNESDTLLWTYLVVRENAHDLYGFRTQEELHFFELLLTVSGVGPKSALAILGLAAVDDILNAIAAKDSAYLTSVSGIGKKVAEKIILELQDKIGELAITHANTHTAEEVDALEALKALGYKEREAREALKQVSKEITGTSERVTEALKILGGAK